jgi:hypothetical protein
MAGGAPDPASSLLTTMSVGQWKQLTAASQGGIAEYIVFQSIAGCAPATAGNDCKKIRDNMISSTQGWNVP